LNFEDTKPKLDINISKTKYLMLFLPVVILVITVATSMISFRVDNKIKNLAGYDNDNLSHISGMFGGQLSNSIHHLRALHNDPITLQAISNPNTANLRQFANSLYLLAKGNRIYDQVRWIDETGYEKIRISRNNNDVIIENALSLQDKSKRYYFTEASALNVGEIYVSKIDLNQEHGEVDYPIKPTIRIAISLDDYQGKKKGIIILNLLMQDYFRLVDKIHGIQNDLDYLLINQDGYLLNEPKFLLNNPEYYLAENAIDLSLLNIEKSYPGIWDRVKEKTVGSVEEDTGLWNWKTIYSARDLMNLYPAISGFAASKFFIKGDFRLTLISKRSVNSILKIRQEERIPTMMLSIMIIVVYGLSLYFFMKSRISSKYSGIASNYADAQIEKANRIKEIENRFSSLFEANVIPQLVVDVNGNIELANKAACNLFQYEKNRLQDSNIELLIPEKYHIKHKQHFNMFMIDPIPRKMGNNEKFPAVTKNGENISVEIGLNPYFDKNRKLVLVTIISAITS